MNNSSTYIALDLLDKVIEFTNRSPDSAEWSFQKQKGNSPRFVRLEQIWAMMCAFIPEMQFKDIGHHLPSKKCIV